MAEQKPFMGENVYLFRADDPLGVLESGRGGSSMGEYLTGSWNTRSRVQQQKEGVTLRQVYHQWYGEGSLAGLPEIILTEEGIRQN